MEIRAITTQAEFLSVREDWDELLARAPAANIFLTFDWLHTWWRHYGGAAQLCILAAYEGRELTGLAPLMIQERRLAGFPVFRRVAFLGTGLSDRLDVLLTHGRERAILEAIVSHLQGRQWDIVDLQEIPEESVTARLLPELAQPWGARVKVASQSVCLVVKLPADPEVYLASLSKSTRRNIVRYGQRIARHHAVSLDLCKGGPGLTDDLQAFFRVYRKCFADRSGVREFVGDKFTAFRQEVATRFATQGRLLLALLRIDGAEAAGELCFQYRGNCYGYNICYDPTWKREHVRLIVEWEVIRHAITIGCREYDCLRGDEAYKYLWGPQPRRHVRIRITRETPKLRLLQAGMRLARYANSIRARSTILSLCDLMDCN